MVMPVGATSFAQALEMTAESIARRRVDEPGRQARGRGRRRRLVARHSTPTRRRSGCSRGRSSARATRAAKTWRSRSTSPLPSSVATAAIVSASSAASSTATR
jgi:hypothetical protein